MIKINNLTNEQVKKIPYTAEYAAREQQRDLLTIESLKKSVTQSVINKLSVQEKSLLKGSATSLKEYLTSAQHDTIMSSNALSFTQKILSDELESSSSVGDVATLNNILSLEKIDQDPAFVSTIQNITSECLSLNSDVAETQYRYNQAVAAKTALDVKFYFYASLIKALDDILTMINMSSNSEA